MLLFSGFKISSNKKKKKYNFEHENQQHIANKKKYFEIELDVDMPQKVLFSKYIFT